MIVAASIGILASIAIPAYQNYTIRAQITETFSLASELKGPIQEYRKERGKFPADNAAAGLPAAEKLFGNYVARRCARRYHHRQVRQLREQRDRRKGADASTHRGDGQPGEPYGVAVRIPCNSARNGSRRREPHGRRAAVPARSVPGLIRPCSARRNRLVG